jgi:hypothetical protein
MAVYSKAFYSVTKVKKGKFVRNNNNNNNTTKNNKNNNSVALVRERTIPTERPQFVAEVSANFCG